MAFTYVLYSQKLDRFYIGATQDEIKSRINKHIHQLYGKNAFTAAAKDWKLFLLFEVTSFQQALRIEQKIKSMKSSVYIRNIKKYPELKQKIFLQTALE